MGEASSATRTSGRSVWQEAGLWRAWAGQVGIGLALAMLLVGSMLVVELALGWARFVEVAAPAAVLSALLVGAGRALLTAVVEETLFRGVLLAFLERPLGARAAVAVSALAFALPHFPNPNVTPLALANLAVAGGLFALAYLIGRGPAPALTFDDLQRPLGELAYRLARGLALPIGLHLGWNLFEGSLFGFPVSGNLKDSALRAAVTGPEWATGGAFGPEGGLVGLGAMLLTAGVLWTVRQRIPQPPGPGGSPPA